MASEHGLAQGHKLGEKLHETTEQLREQATETIERGRQYMERGRHAASDTIAEHPASSVLLSFGLGLGVGLAIGLLLQHEQPKKHWYEAGGLDDYGRRIADAVTRAMPDALQKRRFR